MKTLPNINNSLYFSITNYIFRYSIIVLTLPYLTYPGFHICSHLVHQWYTNVNIFSFILFFNKGYRISLPSYIKYPKTSATSLPTNHPSPLISTALTSSSNSYQSYNFFANKKMRLCMKMRSFLLNP